MKHLKEQTGSSPKALEDENLADKLEKNDGAQPESGGQEEKLYSSLSDDL